MRVISKESSTEKSLSFNKTDFSPTEVGFEMTENNYILKKQVRLSTKIL